MGNAIKSTDEIPVKVIADVNDEASAGVERSVLPSIRVQAVEVSEVDHVLL